MLRRYLPLLLLAACAPKDGEEGGSDGQASPQCDQVIDNGLFIEFQEDMAFLENVVSVNGTVELWGQDISSIEEMRCLERVETLKLVDTSLVDLEPLEKLHTVGALEFVANDDLEDLSRLAGLVELGSVVLERNDALDSVDWAAGHEEFERFEVVDSPLVSSLDGLEATTSIGVLHLENLGLTSVSGLSSLTSAQSVRLVDLDALPDLDGLGSLDSVAGSLSIAKNDQLVSIGGIGEFSGFGDLELVGNDALTSTAGVSLPTELGTVRIAGNDSLTEVALLEGVESVAGFSISDHAELTDISALAALRRAGGDAFYLNANAKLPGCDAQAVVDQMEELPSTVDISDNYDDGFPDCPADPP